MKYLCPLCKMRPDNSHKNILDYEIYDFKCHKHPEMTYAYYCNTCKQNICPRCSKEHKSHIKIEFDENDLN